MRRNSKSTVRPEKSESRFGRSRHWAASRARYPSKEESQDVEGARSQPAQVPKPVSFKGKGTRKTKSFTMHAPTRIGERDFAGRPARSAADHCRVRRRVILLGTRTPFRPKARGDQLR